MFYCCTFSSNGHSSLYFRTHISRTFPKRFIVAKYIMFSERYVEQSAMCGVHSQACTRDSVINFPSVLFYVDGFILCSD